MSRRSPLQRVARRCAVTLSACSAVAWACCYAATFTAFGVLVSAAAMVATTVAAGIAWIASGE